MKARWLFAIVCSIHVLGIGGFMFLQGCATRGDAYNKRPKVARPSAAAQQTKVVESVTEVKQSSPSISGIIMPPKPTSAKDVSAGIQPSVKEFVVPAAAVAAPPRMGGFNKSAPIASNVNIIGATSGAVGTASGAVSRSTGPTQSYKIQTGDSLSKIAYRYKISTRELSELNNITNPNKIKIGQVIELPGNATSRPTSATKKRSTKKQAPRKTTTSAKATGGNYTVKSGDSLSKIAAANGVKTSAIKAANNLSSDRILVGQKLTIPKSSSVAKPTLAAENLKIEPVTPVLIVETDRGLTSSIDQKAEKAESISITRTEVEAPATAVDQNEEIAPVFDATFPYTVQDGETLESIAKAFIVSKEAILKANKLTNEAGVVPGMVLKIPPSEF